MATPKPQKYGYLNMKEAYQDVKEKGMGIRRAARIHGLPESTLRWRLSNNRSEEVKRGGPTIFSRAQEHALAEHCVTMAHLGYGFTRWQILDMARNMCEAIGNDVEPTKHWFYGFLSRFPDLKMVNPKKREKARDEAVNVDMLKDYFNELNDALVKYDIKDKPQYIWNVDETGISLDHNPPKVLAKIGSNPHCVTSGRSATTTVIAAVSALGETIPPYVIFKGERMSKDIRSEGIPGTEYRSSQTGWSNSSLFLDFFCNHFLHHVTTRPCLLLYDGHSTHVTFDIIETARKENVHLFVLPPHSSHCLQPLDVSVFSPFKKNISTECHKLIHANPGRVIVKEDLPKIIGNAFKSSLTVSTIMSGYRKTGIFPFDPSAPCVAIPEVNKKAPEVAEVRVSRKERKDNRNVKILFQEKSSDFDKLKDSVEPKVKKCTFVPPYGATITEDSYYEKKKTTESEKKQKQDKKEKSQRDKLTSYKRKCVFNPPFSQSDLESQAIEREKHEKNGHCQRKRANEDNERSQMDKGMKKGKGPLPNSTRGKGPAEKVSKNKKGHIDNESDELIDTETCVVCGKFQPDALHLDQSIKFVDWGCCMECGSWVHLKFCSTTEKLAENDDFKCPICCSEQ